MTSHPNSTTTSIELDRTVAARILGHLIDLLSTDEALLILADPDTATDDLITLHTALAR